MTTIREVYRNVLIELNKEEASALYVEDFLYYANKAVNWYANSKYSAYDTSQQTSDDLRALRVGPERIYNYNDAALLDCLDKCNDPDQGIKDKCENICYNNLNNLEHYYRHLLNCIITVRLFEEDGHCEQTADTIREYPCKRMTSDRKAAILNNTYLQPKFFRPYYDIVGNRLKILTGTEDATYYITRVEIEYLKNPEKWTMVVGDLLKEADDTMEIEFPDYVITEITNIMITFILEQGSNPRMQSSGAINKSIATPGEGGTQG